MADTADFDVLAIAALIVMECRSGGAKPLRIRSSGKGRMGLATNFVASIADTAGFVMRALDVDEASREIVFRLDRKAVAA